MAAICHHPPPQGAPVSKHEAVWEKHSGRCWDQLAPGIQATSGADAGRYLGLRAHSRLHLCSSPSMLLVSESLDHYSGSLCLVAAHLASRTS